MNSIIDVAAARKQLRDEKQRLERALEEITKQEIALEVLAQSSLLGEKFKQPNLLTASAGRSLKERVIAAKERLPHAFTRREHIEAVIADGEGDVNPDSFSVCFARLVKAKVINKLEDKDEATGLNLYEFNTITAED